MQLRRFASARAPRRPSAAALALTAVAALGIVLPAGSAHAAEKKLITFGVQPATATAPDGRGSLTYGTTPGASVRDHVAVLNFSTKPLRLAIYPTDSLATSDGGFSLKAAKAKTTDVGAWVRLSTPRSVTVPPRTTRGPGQVIVPVTLKVPATATPGDHVGGVVVSLASTARARSGANLKLDQRVATRVYVRVAGDVTPTLQIDDLGASYQGTLNPFGRGSAVVAFTLRNTGNVRLGIAPTVTVSALLGSWSAKTVDAPPQLLPGSSVRVRAVVDGVLPEILNNATVRVDPTAVEGDVDPGLTTASGSVRFWAIPWSLIAIVLLIVGALWWRRSRSSRSSSDTPETASDPILAEVSTS